jgi:hypothetical protein
MTAIDARKMASLRNLELIQINFHRLEIHLIAQGQARV